MARSCNANPKGFPCQFKQDPLLSIHQFCFGCWYAKESGIKCLDATKPWTKSSAMSYILVVLAIKQPPTMSNTLTCQATVNLVCLGWQACANVKEFVRGMWRCSPCVWHDANIVGTEIYKWASFSRQPSAKLQPWLDFVWEYPLIHPVYKLTWSLDYLWYLKSVNLWIVVYVDILQSLQLMGNHT